MKKTILLFFSFAITMSMMFVGCSTDCCEQNTKTDKIIKYKIVFIKNGGTGKMNSISATSGQQFSLPSCTFVAPTGFKFGSWNTDEDGTGTSYSDGQTVKNLTNIDGQNVNLYAIWIEKDAHAIHYYNVNGAENTNPLSFLESRTITLINPGMRTGYTFDGWYFNPSFTGSKVTGWNPGTYENDISLYAKWTPIIYTITYNLNEGTLENSNPASYTIETDTIILNNPTKTGHTFDGWYNGTTKITSIPKGSTGSITLTAKFTIITYTVNFYNDDGSLLLKQLKVDYGTPLTLERSYYNVSSRQLVRWNSNTNGKGTGYLFDSSILSSGVFNSFNINGDNTIPTKAKTIPAITLITILFPIAF